MSKSQPDLSNLSPEEKRRMLAELLDGEAEATSYPVTFSQERLWFIEQLNAGASAYHLPTALRLRGDLDVAALRKSLRRVGQRHRTLQTHIDVEDDQPVQVVDPSVQHRLPFVDLASLDASRREAQARRLAESAVQASFDLQEAPLLRALLIRVAEQDFVLVFVMHHVIGDGWSVDVLTEEIARSYHAYVAGTEPELAALPIQYTDYAAWQRKRLDDGALDEGIAYWKQQLDDAPDALNLPTDHPRPAVQTFTGRSRSVDLPRDVVDRLVSLGQEAGATRFAVLLAAFSAFLYRYTAQDDLVIGTLIANRDRPELQRMIGFLVNTLALRVEVDGEASFRDLVREVRETVFQAHDHQDVPFARVVEAVRTNPDPSRQPLFQVLFSVDSASSDAPLQLPGVEVDRISMTPRTAQFDLSVRIVDGDAPRCVLNYNTDLFEASTIERMGAHFRSLLAELAAEPDAPVNRVSLMDAAERNRLLTEWNDTQRPPLAPDRVHEAVERQAEATPDRVALVMGDLQITYAHLNRASNRLARHLRANGVGLGATVGLYMHRTPDLVVALLATLKAGAAYVPLDPDYPQRRIETILEGAGIATLLTDAPDALGDLSNLDESAEADVHVVNVSAPEADWRQASGEPLNVAGHPEQTAYVTYTSGSTGRPKGVVVPHRSVLNFMAGMDDRVGADPPGTWLAVTTVSFDISVLELLWTAARGFRTLLYVHPDAPEPSAGTRASRSPGTRSHPTGSPVRTAQSDSARSDSARSDRARSDSARSSGSGTVDFSLMYFADDASGNGSEARSGDGAARAAGKYTLLLEGAKFADTHGFEAVWTPERHFHSFGGLYPNPSVTSAGVATVTRNVDIRAGSVVLPLHHPARVAEEWSVVDNFSGGRAGISFATGWQKNDFVYAPSAYDDRRAITLEKVELVQRLWRGETVSMEGVDGEAVDVSLHPAPVQAELPTWLTSAGNPETFRAAGAMGANVLTHILTQSPEELQEKIAIYRAAREEAGYAPETGVITLMLHTFVGASREAVRDVVYEPFTNYLRRSLGLLKSMAPAIGKGVGDDLSSSDVDALLDVAFERFFDTRSLMGTVESCRDRVQSFAEAGVNEIAALIDFGVDDARALRHLDALDALRRRCTPASAADRVAETSARELPPAAREGVQQQTPGESDGADEPARPRRAGLWEAYRVARRRSLADHLRRHDVTHLQCTPSMASQAVASDDALDALTRLDALMLGGEVLPGPLADTLADAFTQTRLLNMYGPTETTVWSTTHPVDQTRPVPIGTPIANTRVYVVDDAMQPVPTGIAGELVIAGQGVVHGYLNRPRETADAFRPDPFASEPGQRLYRTGDRARWRPNGVLDFLGRADNQVKVRGHRIELGEVEAAIERHPSVRRSAATVHGDGSDKTLSAYAVPASSDAPAHAPKPWAHPNGEALLASHDRYDLMNGYAIAHQESHTTSNGYREVFERGLYTRHGITLSAGDCVVDVGGNIGLFTLFAHLAAPDVEVHAVEPIPPTAEVLRTNVALHAIRATVHEVGLAREPGTDTFTFYPQSSGLSGRFADVERDRDIARHMVREGLSTFDVDASDDRVERRVEQMLQDRFQQQEFTCTLVTLSDLIRDAGIEHVDLLKIDVERSELEVLAGIEDEHWARIDQIVMEVDTRELFERTKALLDDHGFTYHVDDLAETGRSDAGEAEYVRTVYATRRPQGLDVGASAPDVATTTADASVTAHTLRRFLQERLPPYMVPTYVETVDALPHTPNGKVDRAALPEPEVGTSPDAGATASLDGSAEEALAQIWQDVLGVDHVGAHDNFFDLGGTSVRIALVHRRLRDDLGVDVDLVDLFQYPTVRTLADFVERQRGAVASGSGGAHAGDGASGEPSGDASSSPSGDASGDPNGEAADDPGTRRAQRIRRRAQRRRGARSRNQD